MIRVPWQILMAANALAFTAPASAQLLDPTNLSAPLSNRNSTAATVGAGAIGQVAMVADPVTAGGDMFDVFTDNPAAVISLVLPGGTEVTSSNAATLGFTYAAYTNAATAASILPGLFNQAGTHTQIVLPDSQVYGTYTVKVNATAANTPVLVIASFLTASPVRAGATTNGATFKIGATVVITGLAFNGATPINNATVTARIVNTANLTATPPEIALVDSGTYDFASGDGLYTGTYTPSAAGNYLAVVRVTGTSAGGPYARTATAAFTVTPPLAAFTSFSNQGVDDDGNGQPDRVVVNALIDVKKAGTYQFGVTLVAGNGNLVKASGSADLALGSQTIPASFRALDIVGRLGVNGPYTLRNAALVYLDGVENPMVDYVDNAGVTAAYTLSSLDQGVLYFTGQNTVTGLDTNSDGKFETLRVRSGVMVTDEGFYEWSARLVNSSGVEIAFFDNSASLSAGANNIDFDFSGSSIGQSCSSGVYSVRSVLLYGPSGSIVADHLLDTAAFTPSQFANTACFLVSVSPNSGATAADASRQFVFSFTNSKGSGSLSSVSALINSSSVSVNGCYIAWQRSDHSVRLYHDQDAGYTSGSDTGNYKFGNSQCTLRYSNPLVESGNNLTLALSLSFAPAFKGLKNIYMQALDSAGADTGLQLMGAANITLGSPCDVDGEGHTNVTDVASIVSEAMGIGSARHDLNSDHVVNVLDIQIVVNAAMGGTCATL